MRAGIEDDLLEGARRQSLHVHLQRYREVRAQPLEHLGDLTGDAGAHQHVIHSSEQGTVECGRIRELNLRQKVDSDEPIVALLGQMHLDERREHGELAACEADLLFPDRDRLVGCVGWAPAWQVVSLENPFRHARQGELFHPPAHVSPLVAILEAPDQHRVQAGA